MMKTKSIFALIVVLILALGLILAGCAGTASPVADPEELVSNPELNAALSVEEYLQPENQIKGVVEIRDTVKLSFPVSGQLAELMVTEGDAVQAGAVVARLNTGALQAEVERAESSLLVAQAYLDQLMAGVQPALIAEAESGVEAAQAMRAVGSAQATQTTAELKAAQARLEYLKSQPFPQDVAVAQAKVQEAQADVAAAKARLGQAELVAPFDGTVVRVFLRSNEYAGSGAAVVQIAAPDNLLVKCKMRDVEVTSLKLGDVLPVRVNAFPNLDLTGTVSQISTEIDTANDKNFVVVLLLNNPPAEVRWGQVVTVSVP